MLNACFCIWRCFFSKLSYIIHLVREQLYSTLWECYFEYMFCIFLSQFYVEEYVLIKYVVRYWQEIFKIIYKKKTYTKANKIYCNTKAPFAEIKKKCFLWWKFYLNTSYLKKIILTKVFFFFFKYRTF